MSQYPFKHFLDVAVAVDEDPEDVTLNSGLKGCAVARVVLEWINETATNAQKEEVARRLTIKLGL
jgi:hypothetical protein